ncbi:tetratricopeptide repeat protein [Photobacterium kasasachensis]|uniref:tetratricopeptide repeat protein n=1 Tax=Photobacterium kasasachensis TaxID=2910240 RepID=UPI003D0BC61F
MKTNSRHGWLLVAAIFSCPTLLSQSVHAATQETDPGRLGKVEFPTSCNEENQPMLDQGLALLHHMTYVKARSTFEAVIEKDPDCAMAYWGVAMSIVHPLWSDPPNEENFAKGLEMVEKAKVKGTKTQREVAYIQAINSYYAQGRKEKETDNLIAFEQGWAKVHDAFPSDQEATAFYALSLLGTASPADKSYVKQKKAGETAATILAKNPKHPGAHHYIIHAYDYPELAEKALDVARSYGEIAPSIPHALHMPTHIFTRLGLWDESIAMNIRSAAAAKLNPAGDKISLHYLHALDYMAYSYLQKAQDKKALAVVEETLALSDPLQPHAASAYTLAAVPARYVLERQQWAEAAKLEPRQPASYPWDKFPAMEAVTHFAIALGAAQTGDVPKAEKAIARLGELKTQTEKSSAYWAKQVEIQRLSALAWLQFNQGDHNQALLTMQSAADLEATTEKHPVTPGEVLPARELLGDMLLEMEKYQQATVQYEAALNRSKNRFNSLYGAAKSAELTGDKDKAKQYYQMLVDVAEVEEADRPQLQQATTYLASK